VSLTLESTAEAERLFAGWLNGVAGEHEDSHDDDGRRDRARRHRRLVRITDAAGVSLCGFTVTEPSLDDVYRSLHRSMVVSP